ncbi:hypothetical protein TPY_1382 [Sulfobacillus acidophilus TPY]|uniref:ATPase BadF/BadG/BcrA/BcrD type n=1 Tax=Sulfobacillus acidophilus (strain ATCC 700253 / DSM 10332 / NAL) TaxID=679936 RepID=G8TU73_SULAD|nr:hypothetical protein TPY_1382 [Sulfobacillus acidophilus TPY]AEW05745.1 ATPase BadF/BadG/BcrA/BcrD type [Sulfobacillus acidophilus DSM 10332]
MSERYYLGIDGGGSHTRALVLDDTGSVVYRGEGGPSNVLVVGEERARASLEEALATWTDSVTGGVLGMAGADRPQVTRFWQTSAVPRIGGPVLVVGDYRIAWGALTAFRPGFIGIFGTGSVVYGENGTQALKVGGYGWRLGDPGSGLELGREAIKATLNALQHIGPETLLVGPVLQWAGVDSAERLISRVYDEAFDWRTVADLAPWVVRLAGTDPVAHAIIDRQGAEVHRQLHQVCRRLGLDRSAIGGLAGGLAPFWLEYLSARWSCSGVPLSLASREPVWGAAEWARRAFGNFS